MVQAYFDCVNDNGGIHGRPIEYVAKEDALDPQLTASQATNLLDSEKVVGLVGSMSVLDCTVNAKTYADAVCVSSTWGAASSASTPRDGPGQRRAELQRAVDGEVPARLRGEEARHLHEQHPGSDAINQSITLLAQQTGVPVEAWLENVPVNDANALALRAVQAAGEGGGVVVNFNPGEAIKVFRAAQQQGLVDRVKWGCPPVATTRRSPGSSAVPGTARWGSTPR